MDIHIENAEPLLRSIFGHQTPNSDADSTAQSQKHAQSKETKRTRRKTDDGHRGEKETCLSNINSYLNQARAMVRSPQGFKTVSSIRLLMIGLSVVKCIERAAG